MRFGPANPARQAPHGRAVGGYPGVMATVALDPYELDAIKKRRRISGLDRLDEVWEGVLHMVPTPSYGHARLT